MKHLKRLLYSTIGILTLVAAGCSSHRGSVTSPVTQSSNLDMRFDSMVSNYGAWDEMSTNIKVELQSPMNLSLSGKAYMVKNKLIHISLKFLGMELAVCHITPDSIYCVDKVHKIAVVEPMSKLSSTAGLDIAQLQSVLLGRLFGPDSDPAALKRSRSVTFDWLDEESDQWKTVVQFIKPLKYTCVFDIGGNEPNVSALHVAIPGHKEVSCMYSGWFSTVIGSMPQSISSDVAIGKNQLKIAVRYTPSSVSVKNVKVPSFKVPGNDYRRMHMNDLLKSLAS